VNNTSPRSDRHRLEAHGLRPKKKHGQNFLRDPGKLRQLIERACPEPGEVVLEVGPGAGVLTQALLEADAVVLAIEIDRDLEPVLHERLDAYGDRFVLHMGDVLASKHAIEPTVIEALTQVLARHGRSDFQAVANLPYHVASPLIAELVAHEPRMRRGLFMVQKEVADRLAANPGGKTYGSLGILVQAMCEVKKVMTLGPGCFDPPPSVDSAVVEVVRRHEPMTDDPDRLSKLLHTLFSKRRKQIGSILGRDIDLPEGVTYDMRPEQLPVGTLCQLSKMLEIT